MKEIKPESIVSDLLYVLGNFRRISRHMELKVSQNVHFFISLIAGGSSSSYRDFVSWRSVFFWRHQLGLFSGLSWSARPGTTMSAKSDKKKRRKKNAPLSGKDITSNMIPGVPPVPNSRLIG